MKCPVCRKRLRNVNSRRYTDTRLDGTRLPGASSEWRCEPCDRTWWSEIGEDRLMTPEEHVAWSEARRAVPLPTAIARPKKK